MLAFLLGSLPGVLKALGSAFEDKQNATTDQARIAADERIARLQAQRDVLVAETGWPVTRWIRPLFAYPVIVHFSAVVADSLFHFTWDVAALPEPMATWEGWVVGAYFITRPIEKLGRNWITSRRIGP
ncbi:MAG: 3TM-type holin [Alphaproteobacteria bacterium]